MNNEFVAHFDEQTQTRQTVEEHLRSVAGLASGFADKIGLAPLGELLGLLHDLGKYSDEFQQYIKSATGLIAPEAQEYVDADRLRGKINHAFAGGQYIWRHNESNNPARRAFAQMLALCVTSHHTGLRDCLSPSGEKDFENDMGRPEAKTHVDASTNACSQEIREAIASIADNTDNIRGFLGVLSKIQNHVRTKAGSRALDPDASNSLAFQQGLLVRYLFSCLIDADRMDSAFFASPEKIGHTQPQWEALLAKLESHIAGFPQKRPIDHIRKGISDECAQRAEDPQGIFTLTVPTGGGKTLASLRFALRHAKEHGLDRVITVIPYTSIIDQNAAIAREILEDADTAGSIVLEHHANVLPNEGEDANEPANRWEKMAENWDSPVIFTTVVQFLETLFGSGTKTARRMHNLANSVIIFDEVQSMPLACLRMFCNAVEFLHHVCGASIVLCTATQPNLQALDRPMLGSLTLTREHEIVNDVSGLFDSLRRNDFRIHRQTMTTGGIAALAEKQLQEVSSCLVVCNTKKVAKNIYAACPAQDGVARYFLSTSLCPAHRKEKLDSLRADLKAGKRVLCVSTQLIECGVDVSFASVIRLAAGLDSVLQSAGRCNRHGETGVGHVHVVRADPDEEKLGSLKDIAAGRDALLDVLAQRFPDIADDVALDLNTPELIQDYFRRYFYQRRGVMSYAVTDHGVDNTLLDMLGSNKNATTELHFPQLAQSFASANGAFKAIDSPTTSVLVPWGEGKDLIAQLCCCNNPGYGRLLLRKAQRYAVNIFEQEFRKLDGQNALHRIADSGILVLAEGFYDADLGVVTEAQALTSALIF